MTDINLADLDGVACHVAWRDEDGRKVPYNGRTGRKAMGPHSQWGGTYKAASGHAKRLGGGLGIVLGTPFKGYRLIGIDLDGCRDPDLGTIAPWARKLTDRFATYTEVSPSVTGVKLFMVCTEVDWHVISDALDGKHGRNFKAKAPKDEKAPGIEAYIGERYFTVTDKLLHGAPENLAVVTADEFLWIIETAGPDFLAARSGNPTLGHTGGWQDETESGIGWRIAVETAREHGADGWETYLDRLDSCDDVSRWREDGRQVERAWDNALEKSERESSKIMFDPVPPEPTPVEALNRIHAVVKIAGRTVIAHRKPDGSIDFGNVTDLHNYYANQKAPKPKSGKLVPVSEMWMESKDRLTYPDGVAFDPSGKRSKRTLNLWTGWAVEPNPNASCKLILSHIRNIICCGHEESFHYFIGWLAHLVQHPEVKPGVSIVARGAKGAGKDIVGEYLVRMIGRRHCPVLGHSEHLTSRFNSDMEAALLLHMQEAYWAGNRSAESFLKYVVTSPTVTIERKGIDRIALPSVMRIFMSSNEEWVVPASADERRWAVFDVSDTRVGDVDYFRALAAEMDGDGPAALLAYLQAYDLTGFSVNIAPQTDGLRDQKLASLRDFDRWWFEVLRRGDLGDAREWPTRISCDKVRDEYNEQAKDDRFHAQHLGGISIGKSLRKLCAGVERVKGGTRASRIWQYELPELRVCRRAFEKYLGASIDWSGFDA